MMSYIVLAIMGYLLFRLFFNLILPILRTTRMVRQEIHRQQDQPRTPSEAQPGQRKATPNWDKMGDYIDFEEIK